LTREETSHSNGLHSENNYTRIRRLFHFKRPQNLLKTRLSLRAKLIENFFVFPLKFPP
jgi:hypothetical protein